MKRPNQRRQRASNAISNVRVVDEQAGTDGLKIDRIFSQMHATSGQIRVSVNSTLQSVGTSPGNTVNYSFGVVTASDEFASFSAQFRTFRIYAAKFDVYNLTPAASGLPVLASTFHNELTNNVPLNYLAVADSDDTRVISPQTIKSTFYWRAHTLDELSYQTTESNGQVVDYGGLQLAFPTPGIGATIQVVAKFIVDFRGRS